jgi:hypothetical protein
MRLYRDSFPWVCVFVLACLLMGCSALRLGYSNGENVGYWWLNSYVDLEADQQPMVRRHIDDLFVWHRKTQLNDYAQLLTQAQRQMRRNVTQADVVTEYDAVKKRMLVMIDRTLPQLTDLALSLRPQQITHLEKKFASNNESYRKDYLRGDLEHRQSLRYKKVMKQAEYWFGNFSAEQEAQIRAASDARPLNNELWMEERVRRQQELIGLLKRIQAEKPSRDAVARMLKDYVTASLEHFGDEKHKAFFDASKDGMMRMVVVIVNLATPEQKEHAVKKLQKWIDDCHTLAAR